MYGRGKFSQSRQMKDLFYSIVKAFNRKVVFISWELSIISALFFEIIHRPCLPSIGLLNSHLLQFVKYWETSANRTNNNVDGFNLLFG